MRFSKLLIVCLNLCACDVDQFNTEEPAPDLSAIESRLAAQAALLLKYCYVDVRAGSLICTIPQRRRDANMPRDDLLRTTTFRPDTSR